MPLYTQNDSIFLLEKIIKKKLPSEYKEFLKIFHDFLVMKEKGSRKVFYFDSIKSLFEKVNIGNSKNIYSFEKLIHLIKENSVTSDGISSHSDNSCIEITRIKNSIIIANYDGIYLYLDVLDNFSVWEFWLDDGSVGKLANTFKDFLSKYDVIDAD